MSNRGPLVKPPLVERHVVRTETVRQTIGFRYVMQQLGIDPDSEVQFAYESANGEGSRRVDPKTDMLIFTKVTHVQEEP